ncbi:MAG: CHAT domain-containing protein [Capsulimonas sp.]|uniref:CHAT domain-containing tetratricopeptide repeat protein n=1 Tax=Capsulimonas sp. TaxID=2494211 RepID=UPI003262E2D0
MKRIHQKLWIRCSLALTLLASGMGHVYAQGPGPDTLTPQQWEDGGLAAITFDDYATAIGSFENAVAGDPHQAKYVCELSEALTHEKRFLDAYRLIKSKLPYFKSIDANVLQVSLSIVHRAWGAELRDTAHPAESIAQFQRAYAIDIILRPHAACINQISIGDAWNSLHNFVRARAVNSQALKIARQSQYADAEILALTSRANIERDDNEFTRSVYYFQRALNRARQSKDVNLEYMILMGLQQAYVEVGKFEKSEECSNFILAKARREKDTELIVETLCNIGRCETLRYRSSESLKSYQAALAVAETEPEKAEVFRGLGDTYDLIGAHEQSAVYYSQAVAAFEAAGDARGALLARIARYHPTAGQRPTSGEMDRLEQMRADAQKIGDTEAEVEVWEKRATAYQNIDAIEYIKSLEESLKIRREHLEMGSPLITMVRIALAESLLGRKVAARRHYLEALIIARRHGLAKEEAYALASYGQFLGGIPGSGREGIALLLNSIPICRAAQDRKLEELAFTSLMFAYLIQGDKNASIFYGKQAVRISESFRSDARMLGPEALAAILQFDLVIYRTVAETLVQQGRLPEAQQILQLMKRKEYRDFAERGGSDTATPDETVTLTATEAAWQVRYLKIADQVTAIGRKREALLERKSQAQVDPAAFTDADKKTLAEVDRDLVVANTAFQKSLTKMAVEFAKPGASPRLASVGETSGLSDTLRNLGPGTVALYTIVEADKYRVIVITSQTQKAEEYAISSAALNKKIMALREALQDPSLDPRPLALELYKILIGPIEKDLAGAQAKTLMWSLDGALRYLPIAALYDGRQYLAERYRNEVFTLASQSRLEDTPTAHWSALGLGVSQAQPGFEALPSVPEELHGIIQGDPANANAVLPGAVLLDAAFTRDSMIAALEDRKYPVVHIASHFSFRPGSDADSFLLLGDGTHLTLADLKSLPQIFQGTDLLTLSACDTAMSAGGDGSGGREIEGCAVIAQRQGARSILASLWPVADESTQMLMRAFYQWRETHPGASKAEALQAAQLSLLHGEQAASAGAPRGAAKTTPKVESAPSETPDYTPDPKAPFAHPYFWAPFVLIGNWK